MALGNDVIFNASASASPSGGGTVSISPSTTQKVYSKLGWTGYPTVSATFSYSATANTANGYVFKGWATSTDVNSGTTANPMDKTYSKQGALSDVTYDADTYYAIFARLTARSTATLAFGTKLIGLGWNEGTTKSVIIDYVHAGEITATITGTNATEFSLSNSSSSQSTTVVSNNTNSETNSTITVYFKPSSEGSKSAKLTISSNNGLTSIEINLSGTGQATVNPTFTNTIAASYYVEAGPLNLASLWTSDNENGTITYSKVSFTADVENETGATVPSISNDNKLSLGQAGTLVIQMHQAASTGYYEKTVKDTIRINKRSNTLYANSSVSFAPTMYTDKSLAVTLTATNTDYAGSPISVEQVNAADTTIAKYEYSQASHSGTVTSRQFLASTSWRMTQPENYKYLAGENTFSVTVAKVSEATNCYIAEDNDEQQWGTIDKSRTLSFDIRGAKCSFQAKRSPITVVVDYTNNQDFYAEYSSDGSNWTQAQTIDLPNTNEWRDFSFNLPSNARYVRFESTTGAIGYRHIRNVKIHRYTYLNVGTDNSSINGTLTINKKDGVSAIYPGEKGQQSTTVYWGIANGGNLKIKCDDPRFTFSQNTITGVDCNSGTTDIYAYYTDTVAGTVTATATVYNDVYNRTFTVKGVIEKADQLITWNNDILRLGQSYTDVATANTLVTYESEDESIIRVDEDDEGHKTILTAVGTGTVNITATAEETSFYAEKSDTKSIKVTEKQIQWIDWNQSLFGLKLGGANVTMNAVAASDVEGCVSSRLIEYSSNNESVVKVVNNNQLQIIGAGTAIITAVQAGGFDTDGHDYERAETEKTVIVRDPNAPCESFAYQQGQEVKMDCGWNALDKQTRTSEINFNGIIPATGTLRYKGEYRKVAINYFDGTMTVEQYIPDENWQPVTGGDLGKPSIGTYKTANLTFDRRATKMRVKVTDGLGYHYFTDCQVTQARFIETTTPVDFNLNVGQQQNQVIYLSYSNITDGLSLTLAQGANSHFSVDKSFIEGSCGSAAKNVALTITYHPTAEETNAQDVLTITDGTTSCQVVLTGSATRVNRHINWDHADETDIYTVQTETLSAEARTDLNELAGTVAFSLAGSSTAAGSVSAENVLSFTSAGVADVVAYTKDDPRYNVAPNVVKTFNVAITPTQIQVAPTVNAITSGDIANINEVVLNGGSGKAVNTINGAEVEGTFAVTSGDVVNAGTNTLQLSFTPSNTDMYSGCTGTTTIVVNKATPVATPSAANIVYGQKVNESVLSNEGTAGTWSWTDAKAEDVLAAGTYNDLAVHFKPTSGNYTELDATVTLTVEKATPEVTAQASAITYGQAISASELSTATGDISGSWEWAVDKTQVLSVGNHALKANFTSADANYSDLSNVDVTLTVNKIEKLEVSVARSFCAGGEVNFHGNTYTEAGEYKVEAEGETRDTVYHVTVAVLQPTTGTDSRTITVGANESWNGVALSGYTVGSHEVVFHTENAAGCDSTVTLTLTVVPLSNVFTNEAGDGDWENPDNWESRIVPTSDPDIIVTGALEVKEDITVGSLTIEQTGSVSVISGGTLTVNGVSEERMSYGDVHVKETGNLVLSGNVAELKVNDFILDASLNGLDAEAHNKTAMSGQVTNAEKIEKRGHAYFDLSFDPSGKISYGWYDFTVPFEVNIAGGISRINSTSDKVMVCGQDFLIMEADEVNRANGGKGWRQFSSGVLKPGKLYTITFDDDVNQNTFRFTWNEAGSLLNGASYDAQCAAGSEESLRGWNGLGNGMLRHGYLAGNYKTQVYNHGENRYELVQGDKTFAVGTAFFIQVEAAGNVGWTAAVATEGRPLYAPRYEAEEVDEFCLQLRKEEETRATDVLYFSASEEATEDYIIGHDLLKMGTPKESKVAQMWTTKGGKALCDIESTLNGNQAFAPLMFYAPTAGSYQLAINKAPEDAMLYLTYNGVAIWALSSSPYTLDLEKGTTEGYGLRLETSNAPQITTGVENTSAEDQARKVIIDNTMYIITKEGAIFNATGKKVQ